MAKLIKMPFGKWTWVGPRKQVLNGNTGPHTWRGKFEGKNEPSEGMPGHV